MRRAPRAEARRIERLYVRDDREDVKREQDAARESEAFHGAVAKQAPRRGRERQEQDHVE